MFHAKATLRQAKTHPFGAAIDHTPNPQPSPKDHAIRRNDLGRCVIKNFIWSAKMRRLRRTKCFHKLGIRREIAGNLVPCSRILNSNLNLKSTSLSTLPTSATQRDYLYRNDALSLCDAACGQNDAVAPFLSYISDVPSPWPSHWNEIEKAPQLAHRNTGFQADQ